MQALDRAMSAARADVARLWATPGAADVESVSKAAVVAAVGVLHEAGCLVEPSVAAPELTVEEAAQLLCQLSGRRRLDEPEKDYVQLIASADMVDYAWDGVIRAGLDPADITRAQQARRLLLAHHGRR